MKYIENFKTEAIINLIKNTINKIENEELENPSLVIQILPACYGNYIPQMVGHIFEKHIDFDDEYYDNFIFLEDRLSEAVCKLFDDQLPINIDLFFGFKNGAWGLQVQINK